MISLADIQAARARIRDSILFTPAPYSETLSRHADNTLYLKMENLHLTGSFKERGALNRILLMTDEERARGVITASAGNHAQAVAYHAAKRGIRVQICMPVLTPLVKVTATRGYGAESSCMAIISMKLSMKLGGAARRKGWYFCTRSTMTR